MDKPRQYRSRPVRKNRANGMSIGTYAGAPIVFTSSWIFLGVLLIVMFAPLARRTWPDLGSWSYAVAALVVVILGFSTLIHEMAHAVVAHRSGLRITAINVTFWGGATHLASTSPTPLTRALLSGAGPVSNLILAGFSYLLWQLPAQGSILWALLAVTTFVNLFVGVLNLFPALPLDGGGLVEALIWAIKKDQYEATRLTARVSQIMGIALAVSPFIWMAATRERVDYVLLIWSVILGAAMWSTGHAVRQRPRTHQITGDIFLPAMAIGSHHMLSDLPERIASLAKPELPAYPDQAVVVVRAANGEVTGWVDPQAVSEVPRSLAATTPVSSVSQSLPPEAIVSGFTADSDHWIAILQRLPHGVAGLIVVDDGSTDLPGEVKAAVNTERLVAQLVGSDR